MIANAITNLHKSQIKLKLKIVYKDSMTNSSVSSDSKTFKPACKTCISTFEIFSKASGVLPSPLLSRVDIISVNSLLG